MSDERYYVSEAKDHVAVCDRQRGRDLIRFKAERVDDGPCVTCGGDTRAVFKFGSLIIEAQKLCKELNETHAEMEEQEQNRIYEIIGEYA